MNIYVCLFLASRRPRLAPHPRSNPWPPSAKNDRTPVRMLTFRDARHGQERPSWGSLSPSIERLSVLNHFERKRMEVHLSPFPAEFLLVPYWPTTIVHALSAGKFGVSPSISFLSIIEPFPEGLSSKNP